MKNQPSDRGFPMPTEPRSQTLPHRHVRNMMCLMRTGSHLLYIPLSHFPPGPASGNLLHHSRAKRQPVSLAPAKCQKGTSHVVSQPYHSVVHSCSTYSHCAASQPNSPRISRSKVELWCLLCSIMTSIQGKETKSAKQWVMYVCQSYGGKVAPWMTSCRRYTFWMQRQNMMKEYMKVAQPQLKPMLGPYIHMAQYRTTLEHWSTKTNV